MLWKFLCFETRQLISIIIWLEYNYLFMAFALSTINSCCTFLLFKFSFRIKILTSRKLSSCSYLPRNCHKKLLMRLDFTQKHSIKNLILLEVLQVRMIIHFHSYNSEIKLWLPSINDHTDCNLQEAHDRCHKINVYCN